MTDDEVIKKALGILEARVKKPEMRRKDLADYFRLELAERPNEVFCVAFLDSSGGVTDIEELAQGTHCHFDVPPRLVVQRALMLNAASVVFAHNHPTGNTEPSPEDIAAFDWYKNTLWTFEIALLDEYVVGPEGYHSVVEYMVRAAPYLQAAMTNTWPKAVDSPTPIK